MASSSSACTERPLSTLERFPNVGAFRSRLHLAPEDPPRPFAPSLRAHSPIHSAPTWLPGAPLSAQLRIFRFELYRITRLSTGFAEALSVSSTSAVLEAAEDHTSIAHLNLEEASRSPYAASRCILCSWYPNRLYILYRATFPLLRCASVPSEVTPHPVSPPAESSSTPKMVFFFFFFFHAKFSLLTC